MTPPDTTVAFLFGMFLGWMSGVVVVALVVAFSKPKKSDALADHIREIEELLKSEADHQWLWLQRYEEHRNKVRLG